MDFEMSKGYAKNQSAELSKAGEQPNSTGRGTCRHRYRHRLDLKLCDSPECPDLAANQPTKGSVTPREVYSTALPLFLGCHKQNLVFCTVIGNGIPTSSRVVAAPH